ncbi:cryptochrome/photolyase family protein [Flavihumibacter fluvii]|uniref:cryptochrome/photolyase family protein n=1 Tax=Flavihumibacter fluvii TaxID=2838157 RepID=UPI001BDE9858|nr:cryptochrome/photolyase family protein [Flavihumibacter fluvii]ULQ52121.1 cryptochrome/photolyase family protein [Flavihumibacter fluvii]
MAAVTIIFPHQLFREHPAIQPGTPVYLIEEKLFFTQLNFHKQKLVLHRASMKYYESWLQEQGIKVVYIEAQHEHADTRRLVGALAAEGISEISYADPVDDWLQQRLERAGQEHQLQLNQYPTPNFLNQPADVAAFFRNKQRYFQTDFYTWQRKQRQLLLDADQKPLGGKWTFDADNRQKFPKQETVPEVSPAKENTWVAEARAYVMQHFGANYGAVEPFIYPVTFADAATWLQAFLQQRFEKFGVYEDAMVAKESFLYHAVLTPMLNIGLLSPATIITTALQAASQQNIPLNSTEGFIRQVVGWREFIRIVYDREGSRQRTRNYWGFTRKIPPSFWQGTTGIAPIDLVVKKVLATGYCHHIERLMVLGNFMLLCEFDPDEVYRWFMELFIDAYDWVMVPNVYGMTQFADGGLMTTKPYISGSNYLLKMSDFPKGDWTATWDALFWRFMHVHRDFFLTNPRLGMLVKTFDKMPKEKQQAHLTTAENYLNSLWQ